MGGGGSGEGGGVSRGGGGVSGGGGVVCTTCEIMVAVCAG